MKKNKRPSIDGFIPRRVTDGELGQHHLGDVGDAPQQEGRIVNTGDDRTRVIGVADKSRLLSGTDNDLTQSLNAIDEESEGNKEVRKKIRGGRGVAKPKSKTKRIIKWVALGLILAGLIVGGYTLLKFISAGHSIF